MRANSGSESAAQNGCSNDHSSASPFADPIPKKLSAENEEHTSSNAECREKETASNKAEHFVVENESNRNMGNGIETIQGALDNYIVNNQMLGNTGLDAFSDPISVNRWNENNQCKTQSAPQPPPGVCGPDE